MPEPDAATPAVAQPRAEMGRAAMRIVLGGRVERVVLDPELVVRDSA